MAATGFDRTQRIASEIKKDLAFFIQHELNDPLFRNVTITAVRVSRDISYATIYFTLMGENKENVAKDVEKKLKTASGYLRKLVAKRLTTRIIPQLRFFYDTSIQRGAHLEDLIDSAIKQDETRPQNPSKVIDDFFS